MVTRGSRGERDLVSEFSDSALQDEKVQEIFSQ